MNTAGHHSVADVAGLPLLEAAFARVGAAPRLAAFYMGNWLTDVSQAVDPVAYQALYLKLQGFADDFVKTLDGFDARGFDFGLLDNARTRLKNGCNDILSAFEHFLGADQGFPRNSPLGSAVKSAFLVTGYFKFAHPGEGQTTPPMDFDAFMAVFQKRYTQYYPHEHLDRPEKPLGSGNYPCELASGTLSPRHKESLDPDLYTFLREDIRYVAGILAEVDHDWARKYLTGDEPTDDTDKDWNLMLAKLGHALHAVEDFFAHSNFAEHAARALGQFLPQEDRDATVFARRLKRFEKGKVGEMDLHKLQDETHVVTGYFDFLDTFVSLSHIAEHLFHIDDTKTLAGYLREGDEMFKDVLGEAHGAGHEAEDEANREEKALKKLLTDSLIFATHPADAVKDRNNEVAARYRSQYADLTKPLPGKDIGSRVVADFPLFRNAPQDVKDNFVNAVDLFSRTRSIFGYTTSLFGILTSIKEILETPVSFLEKAMYLVGMGFLTKVLIHAFKTFIYDKLLHQLRIGSHSLLAKDHGPEFLYAQQKNCGIAVHYYIIKMLTRWSEPKPVHVSRAHKEASGPHHLNTVDSREWIDWLELLEYFLRHPAKPPGGSKSVRIRTRIMHKVAKGDSLATLGEHYRQTAFAPATFSWESIADANYNTRGLSRHDRQLQVNRYLKETGQGYLLPDKINYAWNLGIYVTIPDQLLPVSLAQPAHPEHAWYKYVMTDGWEVFKGFENRNQARSVAPRTFHAPFYVRESDVLQLRDEGRDFIKELENRYVPGGSAGPSAAAPGHSQDRFIENAGARMPHFCQADSRWAQSVMGGGASLRAKGCAVSSLAMVLKFYGRDVTPGSLDEFLLKNHGYAGNSVTWAVALSFKEGSGPKLARTRTITDPASISETLAARVFENKPTLARIDYRGDADTAYNHFVVIVGQKADGTFIMNDPAASAGNGAANPAPENILEKTRRGGGYKIAQIDLIDPR